MIISPNNNILINPAVSRQTVGKQPYTANALNAAKVTEHKFDTVTIETEASFQKKLQSKISQEIRTTTTTGMINNLREQVMNGEYQVDARNIARRLMFVWEV